MIVALDLELELFRAAADIAAAETNVAFDLADLAAYESQADLDEAAAEIAAGEWEMLADEEYSRFLARTYPTREELEAGYPGATAAEVAAAARAMGEEVPF